MSKVKGMSPGMLRSRRRDVNLKPNRVLDKGSSRGMIYENEELRLRTINITSEIERGQSELKKLKRENDHLRREIWALRDEVDRLEALLKQKEQEEEEEEDEEDDDEDVEAEDEAEDEGGGGPQRIIRIPKVTVEPDGLSVVPEESEDGSTPEPQTPSILQACMNPERRVEQYKGTLPPCIRLNCVHPYTTATNLKPSIANITTVEVIEAVGRTSRGLVGVRLLEDSLYLSWRGKQELEIAVSSGIILKGEHLTLHDVSQGTVVLAMTAIPHTAKEPELVKLLSQFGPVIGGLERRVYRGADTGEGLVRLRPLASLPKRLYLEGAEISVRPLCHEELSKLSMEQHTVRQKPPINLNIRLDKEEGKHSESSKNSTPKSEGGKSSTSNTPKTEAFTFPASHATSSHPTAPTLRLEERSQSAPIGPMKTPEHGSVQSLRPHSDSETKPRGSKRIGPRRGKSPSSGSEQESPAAKPARRRASIVPPQHDRERSNSLSSRASYSKRKMSVTGRETGKLPWCACWGNGCY